MSGSEGAWLPGPRGRSPVCGPTVAEDECPDEAHPDFDYSVSPILAKMPDGRDVLISEQKSGVCTRTISPERAPSFGRTRSRGDWARVLGVQYGSGFHYSKWCEGEGRIHGLSRTGDSGWYALCYIWVHRIPKWRSR